MSAMVERVAKAIAGYMHPDRLDKYWDDWISEEEKKHYLAQARAAIEAMREPTESVLEAGPLEPYMDRDVWAKMIDAALQGK